VTTGRAAGAPPEDAGDRIEVRGLQVEGIHGVDDDERSRPQPFEVDLDIYLDTAPAGSSDDVGDTADYARAVAAAAAVVRGPSRRLLESLAAAVADAVLADRRAAAVTVVVRKLAPPVSERLGSAGVRLHRRRPSW
jgi:dihydroneopterin aldolase